RCRPRWGPHRRCGRRTRRSAAPSPGASQRRCAWSGHLGLELVDDGGRLGLAEPLALRGGQAQEVAVLGDEPLPLAGELVAQADDELLLLLGHHVLII